MPSTSALFDLSGRVAIITGGSRGLGREMALAFTAAGASIVVASRDNESCQRVVAEIEAMGGAALAYACNVGHWDELDGLVDASYQHFGTVDVLVNNAGMSPLYPDPLSMTEALVDKVIGVNLKGPLRLSALVGTRMAAGSGGSIINISSTGAIRPRAHIIPYAAAKAGLLALTEAYAHAFGPTVRVNSIMPGFFQTDIGKSWDPVAIKKRTDTFALKRVGDPHEIAGAALYLASDASSYVTGSCITIDGGGT